MGDSWEEIVRDPIAIDLQVILRGGFYGFEAGKLNCLPSLFGTDDRPASASDIREKLRPLLMADDPGKRSSDKDLSLNSRLNLTLFRADGDSKPKSRKGAQELAGRLQRPASPLSSDAVRKRPSSAQPKGGLEWKRLIEVREAIRRWARSEGKELPQGLVDEENGTAPISVVPTDSEPTEISVADSGPIGYVRTEPWEILNPEADFFDRKSSREYIKLLRRTPTRRGHLCRGWRLGGPRRTAERSPNALPTESVGKGS